MNKLLRGSSILLFILICCSFFSCEKVLELIKPINPPNSAPTCKILREDVKEFIYDEKGRISAITNYGSGNGPGNFPVYFYYNAKNQVDSASYQTGYTTMTLTYQYDEQGRIKQILADPGSSPAVLYSYTLSYKVDTIVVDSKFEYTTIEWPEQKKAWTTELYFTNGNLVRAYQPATATHPYSFDYGFTYLASANKLAAVKKKLAFLLLDFFNPLMSGQLPLSRQNLSIENSTHQTDLHYKWIINEQLYPVNNGLDNGLCYDYTCK